MSIRVRVSSNSENTVAAIEKGEEGNGETCAVLSEKQIIPFAPLSDREWEWAIEAVHYPSITPARTARFLLPRKGGGEEKK